MDYSMMLNAYLEDDLPGSREETLFRALAEDEELRSEFKYMLKLRDAVREDDEAYAVPYASSSSVFSQLGYSTPAFVAGAAAGNSFFRTIATHASALVVGILLSSGFFLLTQQDEATVASTEAAGANGASPNLAALEGTNGRPAGGTSTKSATAAGAAGSAGVTPVGPNANGTAASVSAAIPERRVAQGIPNVTSTSTSSSGAFLKQGVPRSGRTTPIVENAGTQVEHEVGDATREMMEPSETLGKVVPVMPSVVEDANELVTDPDTVVEVENRSNMRQAIAPEVEIGVPFLSNPQFGMRYAVTSESIPAIGTTSIPASETGGEWTASTGINVYNSHWTFALEFGHAKYLQQFTAERGDGTRIAYEQLPGVMWGGIGLRYTLMPKATLTPYAQILGGGSEAGPIARGLVGINANLFGGVNVTAGLEASHLWYAFQDKTWTSQSYGAVLGFSYNFLQP